MVDSPARGTPDSRVFILWGKVMTILFFEKAGSRDAVNRGLYVDLRSYLCDNILAKVDRTSMAVSLETRVPYLDPDLVNLAFRIPGRFKVSGGRTKRILKTLAARRIPRECAYRPKEGFSIPIKHWLGTELAPRIDHLLAPGRLREQGIFDLGTVAQLRSEHAAGVANHSHMIWSLVVFQAWADRWLANGACAPAADQDNDISGGFAHRLLHLY